MKTLYTILSLLIFSLTKANGQYVQQMYTGLNDTLYYGFDYPEYKKNIYEYPLMVWLTNNNQIKDSLSICWGKYLNKNRYVTITPYLKSNKKWDISDDTTQQSRQIKGLTNIFIGRDDVIDTSVTVCGYNKAGFMAMDLKLKYPKTFNKAVIFMDDELLLKKCRPDSKIIYIIPKSLNEIATGLNLKYFLVDRINESEFLKLSKSCILF